MAYIRTHETTARRNGKPVKRYEVIERVPAKDARGKLIPGKTRARQSSFSTAAEAEAYRDKLNDGKHSIGGADAIADAREKAARSFAYYADRWLIAQKLKVDGVSFKQSTYDLYDDYLTRYALNTFSDRAVGSLDRGDCERFLAELSEAGLSKATRRLAWQMLKYVLDYAVSVKALDSNPCQAVDTRAVPSAPAREHRPLSGPEIATVAAKLALIDPVDELLFLFLCYTGLREAEAQGTELRDLTFVTDPDGDTSARVRIERTKKRKGRAGWIESTPKSKLSTRTVPLPGWLAARMADYLTKTHGDPTNPNAPLWARRLRGKWSPARKRFAVQFDWTMPMDLDGWRKRVLQPAVTASGIDGFRLHDTRHTFASQQLSAGVHFMVVRDWMGHSSHTLTLNTYGKWIPEKDGGVPNTLPEPVVGTPNAKVVNLFEQSG
jgi:integrase